MQWASHISFWNHYRKPWRYWYWYSIFSICNELGVNGSTEHVLLHREAPDKKRLRTAQWKEHMNKWSTEIKIVFGLEAWMAENIHVLI
jgi:hypothetical protein